MRYGSFDRGNLQLGADLCGDTNENGDLERMADCRGDYLCERRTLGATRVCDSLRIRFALGMAGTEHMTKFMNDGALLCDQQQRQETQEFDHVSHLQRKLVSISFKSVESYQIAQRVASRFLLPTPRNYHRCNRSPGRGRRFNATHALDQATTTRSIAEAHVEPQDTAQPIVWRRYRTAFKGTPHYGRFTAVDRPYMLQHTWMSPNTAGLESTVTVTFEKKGKDPLMTLVHAGLPDTDKGRSHEKGWGYFVDMLPAHFAQATETDA